MSLNRGIRKPPCGCYRCRYEAWRQRAVLRRRIGMRPPARPAKHPAMTSIPCPCGTCAYRREWNRNKRKAQCKATR